MKSRLTLSFLIFFALSLNSQSVHKKVEIPYVKFDLNTDAFQIMDKNGDQIFDSKIHRDLIKIIDNDSDWKEINTTNKLVFLVNSKTYNGLKVIAPRVNDGLTKYIFLNQKNNHHPANMEISEQAFVKLDIRGSNWIIDRMSFKSNAVEANKEYAFDLSHADNNIINRAHTIDSGGVIFRDGCDDNIVQNCKMVIESSNSRSDRAAIALINTGAKKKFKDDVMIKNTWILDNEIYNHVDGFQSVIQADPRYGESQIHNTDYSGTVVDGNHFYIDNKRYTDCNGNLSTSGDCAFAENAIDLKCGSKDENSKFFVTNNVMWGFRESDKTDLCNDAPCLDDPGSAITVHFGVENVVIANNIVFDSDRGIHISGTDESIRNSPNTYGRSMVNSQVIENLFYKIRQTGIVCQGVENVTISRNTFKEISMFAPSYDKHWGYFTNDDVTQNDNQKITFSENIVADCFDCTPAIDRKSNPFINNSGNKYYKAIPLKSRNSKNNVTKTSDPTSSLEHERIIVENYLLKQNFLMSLSF